MAANSSTTATVSTAANEAQLRRPSLWTRGYVFLLISVFFGYFGQQIVLPVLPLYITELGGSAAVAGLILAAFSFTSFPLRPLVGYLTDAWSARGVLAAGTGILAVTAFGFFVPFMGFLAVLNAIRGLGWAGLNTAGYTLIARAVPRERWGEASGYYNLSTSLPLAVAPAVGLWLLKGDGLGFPSIFLVAAACGAAGFAVAYSLRWVAAHLETAPGGRPPLSVRGALVGSVDRRVALPTGLLLCLTITQVALSAFLPLYAIEIGVELEKLGLAFILYGVVGTGSQLLGARYLDRGPRGAWLAAGYALTILSMFVLLWARGLEMILLGSAINAVAGVILNTMLMVVAMELADPERPGAGMATYSMAYQGGAALGAPLFGLVIELLGFGAMWVGSALALSLGLVVTLVRWSALSGRTRPAPS